MSIHLTFLRYSQGAPANPIFSGYMEPVGSKHNLVGECALVIFQFYKISRPDFI
jgi:hypothetical protein